jgi:hypothetical protein
LVLAAEWGIDLPDLVDGLLDPFSDGRTPAIGFESEYGHDHCSQYLLGDFDA